MYFGAVQAAPVCIKSEQRNPDGAGQQEATTHHHDLKKRNADTIRDRARPNLFVSNTYTLYHWEIRTGYPGAETRSYIPLRWGMVGRQP